MSMHSSKSISSLTPIEDSETDPLESLRTVKYHSFHEGDSHKRQDRTINQETDKNNGEVLNAWDGKIESDVNSLERFEKSPKSDGIISPSTSQGSESRNLIHDNHADIESKNSIERSLVDFLANNSDERNQSPTVLLVQESPSESVLDTVNDTLPDGTARNHDNLSATDVNNGDNKSSLETNNEGYRLGGEASTENLNDFGHLEANEEQFENDRISVLSYEGVLSKRKEPMATAADFNRPALSESQNTQTPLNSSQFQALNHSLKDSLSDDHISYNPLTNSRYANDKSYDETSKNVLFDSSGYFDREDSVERSYFTSFSSNESRIKSDSVNRPSPTAIVYARDSFENYTAQNSKNGSHNDYGDNRVKGLDNIEPFTTSTQNEIVQSSNAANETQHVSNEALVVQFGSSSAINTNSSSTNLTRSRLLSEDNLNENGEQEVENCKQEAKNAENTSPAASLKEVITAPDDVVKNHFSDDVSNFEQSPGDVESTDNNILDSTENEYEIRVSDGNMENDRNAEIRAYKQNNDGREASVDEKNCGTEQDNTLLVSENYDDANNIEIQNGSHVNVNEAHRKKDASSEDEKPLGNNRIDGPLNFKIDDNISETHQYSKNNHQNGETKPGNEEFVPTVLKNSDDQEKEGEPVDYDRNMGENLSEDTSNSTGRSSPSTKESYESESVLEFRENNSRKSDRDARLVRVSKSYSTLSVKTISSTSSRISSATSRSKVENKKLDRLLNGPYSESPRSKSSTPRKKGKPKSDSVKTKISHSQEKSKLPKPKVIATDKNYSTTKLQLHNTRKKSSNPQSNSNTKKKSQEKEIKNTDNTKTSLRPSIDPQSNHTTENQRSMYQIQEIETEANENMGGHDKSEQKNDQIPTVSVNESGGDAQVVVESTSLSNGDDNHQKVGLSSEEKEKSSSEMETSTKERSDSLSKKLNEVEESKDDEATTKITDVERKFVQHSLMLEKKKITISPLKTNERLSAREIKVETPKKANDGSIATMSPLSVHKRGNPNLNQPPGKSNTNKNEDDNNRGANKEAVNYNLTSTTITIIDETNDSPKTNSTAGRIVLNNIKMNLRKKSLQKSSISIPKTSKSKPNTSSPEKNALNRSGSLKEGKTAYKTQSMSSLQVPGQPAAQNPWDPPKEEDTLSIYSRRPSMDSVSRKSVDYRIRNTSTVIQPHIEEKPKSVFNNDETYIQNAVPCLPLGLAVVCLLLNTVLPGSGTALSGISILCCGQSRLSNKDDQTLNTICANLIVGLAQLLTVSFLLVGWFWSVGWGMKMVSLSVKRRQEIKQQREKELQTLALSAFGSPKRLNGFGVS